MSYMKIEQKNNLLSNIDFLLKKRKMKKSDLETKAGASVGYLSRFKNEDPNNLPSVSFIESVANQLNVTLDLLLNSNLQSQSDPDLYIIKFMSKLIKDTDSQNIIWKTFDAHEMRNRIAHSAKLSEMLPFVPLKISYEVHSHGEETGDEDGNTWKIYRHEDGTISEEPETWTNEEYVLGFKPQLEIDREYGISQTFVNGCYYSTKLSDEVTLYFLESAYYDDEENDEEDMAPFEFTSLWIVGEKADEIANSQETFGALHKLLNDLQVAIYSSSIGISRGNRAAIDDFLNNKD